MRLSLVVGVLLFVSPALAAETGVDASVAPAEPETIAAQPCRPTIACMAELVPAGFFEVEAGYGGRQSAGAFVSSGQLLLKYSVLDNLQVQLATNNVFIAGPGLTPHAFDGVMPGLKWKLNDQGDKVPSNALSVHVLLPTHGFAEAVQKTVDLQAWWYASKDLSIVHADLNLMLNVADLGGRPTPQGLATLAVSVELPRGFGLFTEAYSTFGNAGALPLDGGSLNGISYSPIDELVFDAGVDVGFYPGTRSFSVFAGVTFVPHGRSRVPLARARGAGTSGLLAAR